MMFFCTSSSLAASPKPPIFALDGIFVWLDGEFYNQEKIVTGNEDLKTKSDAEILGRLYLKNRRFNFLELIDGQFSAVIYDSIQKKVHLLSDRLGLRFLFWTMHNGSIAWSSEVKAFLALPGFEPVIDRQAIKEFFAADYLLELRTWFEGVSLIPAASVTSWDIPAKSMSTFRYWWWGPDKTSRFFNH